MTMPEPSSNPQLPPLRAAFEAHMDATNPAHWRTTAHARDAWEIWQAAVLAERERLIPERDAIGELLCSVADNLGDMPISEAWAAAVSKRASDLLIRNDYFRAAAIRARPAV